MKKLAILLTFTTLLATAFAQPSNVDFIDPTIGNIGQLLEATRPTMHLPNQLIRMAPDRKDHLDQTISSFPLNIVSHRMGEVFSLHPVTGAITPASWRQPMRFDHGLETIHPWYYSTYLPEEEITIEFTPGARTGMYRFSFHQNSDSNHLLLGHYNSGPASWQFISPTELTGQETWQNGVQVFCYGVFNQAGTPGNNSIRFPQPVVSFSYAISYISADQAKQNYREIRGKSFEAVAAAARIRWQQTMDQIQVSGGTLAQKRSFFTALYRCYERMVNVSEDGQYYSGYSKSIQKDKRPFYVDDWSWDTYLAQHPLRMILNPAQEEDMLQSYVRMYEQSGWMPTFPLLFGDHACMNGFHSSVVLLDAWRKGVRGFDVQKAYEGMRKNATAATMLPWRNGANNELDSFYYTHGYFPALPPNEKEPVKAVHSFEKRQAVAVTLGHSYDDWAVAQLAKELNKRDDEVLFTKRARNYTNLWQQQKAMFIPKDNTGNFIAIDAKFDGGMGGREYYDENNGYTYMWQVQHDIAGLMELMGGKKQFEAKLDQLFSEGLGRSKYEFWSRFPDATGLVGQFSMGNEPSFHIPYLYNFTDAPWKTQQRIRYLLDVWFGDNYFGIPGDEDGGGMSAFVVFSSMGFYPVTPGLPVYTVGSPVFSKVQIKLPNGKLFQLTANHCSEKNKYIQSARINGKELNTPWFTHEQLVSGAHLELEMGPKPNKNWGKQ